jgi:hypothetical protein
VAGEIGLPRAGVLQHYVFMPGVADLPPFCTEYPPHLKYRLDLDEGGLAPGHHVIARGVCLDGDRLTLHYAFTRDLRRKRMRARPS